MRGPDGRRGLAASLAAAVALSAPALVPATSAAALEAPPEPTVAAAPDAWPEPAGLGSTAYVLVDADSGQVLAERAADERRPVASTIKVLTALTAVERVAMDEEVTVGEEVTGVPGSGVGLSPGDTWTVADLVNALIVRSGNEAAEALAVHVAGSREAFLELMEEDAATLGIEGLELVSVSGLDDANLLSARDLAVLARAGLAHDELRPVLGRDIVSLPGEGALLTRNELIERYAGATGVKTGFTEAAGNSLIGSAEREGRELVAVVLDAGEDPARFEEAELLLDHGFERFEVRRLSAKLDFRLAGGSTAVLVDEVEIVIPEGSSSALQLPIGARPPEDDVRVPVLVDGEQLGELPGVVDDRAEPSPDAGAEATLGRAAVDGVYAALRARAAEESFGS
ncbi:MAG: D-alanyl-D-alanine carboxypeptidase family protein [Nitriliruptoraceae bacterium]